MQKIIYTDYCDQTIKDKIQSELHINIVKRKEECSWNIQDSIQAITDPKIVIAVFNNLDEIALLEIGILLFLCKPVLVTDKAIEEYDILSRQVDYIDVNCNLKEPHSTFPSWFKYMEKI